MYEFVQILRVTQPRVAKQLGRRHSKHRLFFEALEGGRKGAENGVGLETRRYEGEREKGGGGKRMVAVAGLARGD